MTFIYREHAIQRMFERDIFEEYSDDKPYPSFLTLKFFDKALHVVFAKNKENDEIIIITAYYPDEEKWSDDYKIRIKK